MSTSSNRFQMPSFSSLPYRVRQSIYALVALNSSSSRLGAFATVSREWQSAFEPFTFSSLHLTPQRLVSFGNLVVGARRAAVHAISFHIVLDTVDKSVTAGLETRAERQHSRAVFTAAVTDLFSALARWEATESPHRLDLQLLVYSPGDLSTAHTNGSPVSGAPARGSGLELDLDAAASLPYVDVVESFRCTAGRHVRPTTVVAMVSRLRDLERLDVRLNDDSADGHDIKQRTNFATGLGQHAPALTMLNLHRPRAPPRSTAAPCRQQWSVFHTCLRRFSQRCTSLVFDDCINASDFFAPFLAPGNDDPLPNADQDAFIGADGADGAPFWPRLEHLKVRNSYLLRPPYLRASSRGAALVAADRLLAALGRAVSRMPRLRRARVCQCVLSEAGLDWIVLTYRWDGKETAAAAVPALEIRGLVPGRAVVEAWRASVAKTRGVELALHVGDAEGETVLEKDLPGAD